jgi:plastocyanin
MENPGVARQMLPMAILFGVVLSLAVSGGSISAKQSWTVTAGGTTKSFAVVANTFQPRRIEVGVGDTITWK